MPFGAVADHTMATSKCSAYVWLSPDQKEQFNCGTTLSLLLHLERILLRRR